jgi:hypothetical protein
VEPDRPDPGPEQGPDENAGAEPESPPPAAPAPRARSGGRSAASRPAGGRAAGREHDTTELHAGPYQLGDPQQADARPGDGRQGAARPGDSRPAEATGAVRPAPIRPTEPGAGPPAYDAYNHPTGAQPAVPNVYRARRPGAAFLLIVPAVVVGLLLVRGLAIAAFGAHFDLGGIIASALGLAAIPLLVAGLYGLMTGAAYGAEQYGFRVWARPPLGYLVVGIALAVAAGLAAH